MRLLFLVMVVLFSVAACTGVTETNVVPLPCSTDAQCGDGLRCLPVDGGAPDGGFTGVCETRP